jgi:A/G-specific adenine glycosylase
MLLVYDTYNEEVNTRDFQEMLTAKAAELYRSMPWREDTRPYYVLVSELMLQQTQVDRVIPKFEAFISTFPDEKALAMAPLSSVLQLWNGLGYNRRAKYLHEAAKMIVHDFNGAFPSDIDSLLRLPGVGPNTAGAILAYAFNEPIVFVETNVRTVYFHHFFEDGDKISDKDLKQLVQDTLDTEHPREFYWALMDYGTSLKKQGVGRIQQSVHYKKQSALKGSVREIRGQIVKALTTGDKSSAELQNNVDYDHRFDPALVGLMADGLVTETTGRLHLTK